VIEKFPLSLASGELFVDDFFIFSTSFAEIISRHIPTVKNIDFFDKEDDFLESGESFVSDSLLGDYFRSIKKRTVSYVVYKGVVLLALSAKDDDVVVAVLLGADPLFLQKMSKSWLDEKVVVIERELHLLKQARVDAETGLLNLANLQSLLESESSETNLLVTLVELPPVSTSLRHSMKYTHQCVAHLKAFIRGRSVLHYLGHNTFALVLGQSVDEKDSTFESNLLAYLKKAGCARVHVGSSTTLAAGHRISGNVDYNLLDEAWTALHKASTRGPFSFCEYKHLAFPEKQVLAHPESNIVRKINRWSSKLDSFALILFKGDNDSSIANTLLQPYVSGFKTISIGADIYVLYPALDMRDVASWVDDILTKISDDEKSIQISAGISNYPFADIKKSEMPFCCKKALLHAAFFGPSSYAVFDHVTLNISGDVYFGDGDFTLAIKDYKRGLKCCGGDVNLYNSLGVTLAMMNRTRQADESFKSGLAIDPNNFMALYNIGLSNQSQGKKNEAVQYLGKAFDLKSDEDVDPHLLNDLKLQLGILSCETGLYESAIKYIDSWLVDSRNSNGAGRVQYYLGLSHYQLGDIRSAIKALERALRFDSYDDRAMNLLGRSYLREKEGEDIALSLCKKSVELEPDNPEYKMYLSEIYITTRDFEVSRELLKLCLKRKGLKPYAQLLMGEGYVQESNPKRAESWLLKVLQHQHIDVEVIKRAKFGLKTCKSLLRKVK
jgi:tetratricopeptide (TPR) repeat protein